jgi:hypothetical protein
VIVEQLFKSRAGHLPRLAILSLLRSQSFRSMLSVPSSTRPTTTTPLVHLTTNLMFFVRGHLDDLKAILPRTVRWAFLSATFSTHIRTMVERLTPGYVASHYFEPSRYNLRDPRSHKRQRPSELRVYSFLSLSIPATRPHHHRCSLPILVFLLSLGTSVL